MKSRVVPHNKRIMRALSVLLVATLATAGICPAAFAVTQAEKDQMEAEAAAAVDEASRGVASAENALADAESAVERSASVYDQAQAQANDLQSKVDALQAQVDSLMEQVQQLQSRIQQIQSELPGQKDAANKALVSLYKLQQEGCSLLDMILGSENILDFLNRLEAINRIQAVNVEKLNKMVALQEELAQSQASLDQGMAELETEKAQLEAEQAAAEAQRQIAAGALADAQGSRAAAQANADAQRAAEAEAIANHEEIQMIEVPPDANTGSNVANESSDTTLNGVVSSDGADWSSDKSSFVSNWGARIDAYLAGSPLAGQGATFAEAAWEYGVDPRWSPAISCVESSKGRYCFLPHNAWGWGSVSWDSWEEAIWAHVRGLSRGYGYTVTVAAAQKYCPPNWQHWYNTCVSEMDRI